MDDHNHMNTHHNLATGIRQNNLLNFVENGELYMDFVTYNAEAFTVITYNTWVADFTDDVEDFMEETCSLLPVWNDICTNKPNTCQVAKIEMENL